MGISRGDGDTIFLPAVSYARVNFRSAPTVRLTPPFGHATEPKVRLETPAANGTTSGLVTVRGQAWDEEVAMSSVAVLVDGVFQGNATINQARAEVCAVERLPGCPFVGFSRVIDPGVANLAPGPHDLQLRAVNAKGG